MNGDPTIEDYCSSLIRQGKHESALGMLRTEISRLARRILELEQFIDRHNLIKP